MFQIVFILMLLSNPLIASSFSDQYFEEGKAHWLQKNYLPARNAWHKFLKTAEESDRRVNEIYPYYSWMNHILKPQPSVKPSPQPSTKNVVKKNEDPAMSHQPHVTADILVQRAQAARHHGHYEQAVRLYQMAQQLDPDSQIIQQELLGIEKEMN